VTRAEAKTRLLLGLYSPSRPWNIPAEAVAALRRDFPGVEVEEAHSKEDLSARIADAEILFGWAPGDASVAKADRLRWVHSPAAGIGVYLTPALLARSIALTNSRGVHAVPIAEHTIGVLAGLARRLRIAVVEQTTTGMNRERWGEVQEVPEELYGKTLGLFGYGAIGREVARRALAFGMRVIALRRRAGVAEDFDPAFLSTIGLPAEEPALNATLGPADWNRFLEESDAIVVAAPLTPETEGRFDAEAFRRMRRGSWLVNVARGKIVREKDLVAALREGQVGAAALDVFETEPLPRESPLYTLDNVILTPHVSGLSRGFWGRAISLFRANLDRDVRGLPLWNRVDPARGY
jgi:phosphoglycerate dehydrogenase-like enzyme